MVVAYIIGEMNQYQLGRFKDLIFPIAGLLMLGLVSIRLVPLIQAELKKDDSKNPEAQ